jgi:GntR family transcriptional regulator
MIISVDTHSGIPVYRQIVEQVRFLVNSGLAEPEEELPSTRMLSARLGVNPMTISKAYQLLEEEGILERRPGRPLVVRSRKPGEMESTRREQLQRTLRPVVTVVRQLEIPSEEAVDLFRDLLEGEK